MNNTGGLRGWSWIFVRLNCLHVNYVNLTVQIIEGLLTIVAACIGAIGRLSSLLNAAQHLLLSKFSWITQEQRGF